MGSNSIIVSARLLASVGTIINSGTQPAFSIHLKASVLAGDSFTVSRVQDARSKLLEFSVLIVFSSLGR